MEDNTLLEKRREQLKQNIYNRFNSPYDFWALLILIGVAVFRYYYLFKSKTQALWWDEASYLLNARIWAFNLDIPGFPEPVRDWFVPLIWTPLLKMGITEFGLRFITVTVGIFSFYFFYLLVSYFFGRKVGLISMGLAAFFYETVFWSLRLDVGTYSIFFMLTSFVAFFKGVKSKKLVYFFLAIILAVFSFQAHAPGMFSLIIYAVFIPIYTRFRFYKSKKFWICLVFFILVLSPFLIKNLVTTGQLYPRLQGGWFEREATGNSFFYSLIYIKTIPGLIGITAFISFLVGLIISLDIFLIIDEFFKKKTSKKNFGKLLFLMFGALSLTMGIYSLMGPGGAYFEPRFIMPFYLSSFVFAGIGVSFVSNILQKHSKLLSIVFIIFILGFSAYYHIPKATELIDSKMNSYQGIKQAGEWLKQSSNPEDIVMTSEAPQINYYSEIKGISSPDTIEKLREEIIERKAKYLLIWAGIGQEGVAELTNFAMENSHAITPRASFPAGESSSVVIYEIDSDLLEIPVEVQVEIPLLNDSISNNSSPVETNKSY